MTSEMVRMVTCNGPDCTSRLYGLPSKWSGWLTISSVDHIEPYTLTPAQRRTHVEYSDLLVGLFQLHLCPQHLDAFDGHRPRTSARPRQRNGSLYVRVSCECGHEPGVASNGNRGSARPASNTERLWWEHLPPDLRWYAAREPLETMLGVAQDAEFASRRMFAARPSTPLEASRD